jgi:hypothetical protein
MSRRAVNCYDEERFDCIVGWDPPLQAFFGFVEDHTRPEDERLVVWVRETQSLDELANAIGPYASLHAGLRAALEQDRREDSEYAGFGSGGDE